METFRKLMMFVLSFVFVTALFFGGVYLFSEKSNEAQDSSEKDNIEADKSDENNEDEQDGEDKTDKEEVSSGIVSKANVQISSIKAVDRKMILDDKYDEAVEQFSALYFGTAGPKSEYDLEQALDSHMGFYDVGEISSGEYKGSRLLVLESQCDGPCFTDPVYKFAWNKDESKFVLLQKHSTEWVPDYFESISQFKDLTTEIAEITMPEKIKVTGKDVYLIKSVDHAFYFQSKNNEYGAPHLSRLSVAFTHSQYGDVYYVSEDPKTGSSCFYVVAPDGSVARYDFDPGFFGGDTYVEWADGSAKTNLDNYAFNPNGCGISGSCYPVEEVKEEDLLLAGKSTNGFNLYELKNPTVKAAEKGAYDREDLSAAQKLYGQIFLSYRYMMSNVDGVYADVNFDQFLAKNPILYWRDPWGRFATLIHDDVRPVAECGKPVVYLYPTETKNVDVKVDIDEFTVTIPDYGSDGWHVRANPDGKIYNYADGKEYPYLFWEGTEKAGLTPSRGFVIARDEVETFLQRSLDKLGLNSQEKADFIVFWQDRILGNEHPYFFISFLGTREFNKIAPLDISPKPDTLIRVFMYYHPVFEPFDVEPQRLSAIPRKGFTVIEWGGTSSALWKY